MSTHPSTDPVSSLEDSDLGTLPQQYVRTPQPRNTSSNDANVRNLGRGSSDHVGFLHVALAVRRTGKISRYTCLPFGCRSIIRSISISSSVFVADIPHIGGVCCRKIGGEDRERSCKSEEMDPRRFVE